MKKSRVLILLPAKSKGRHCWNKYGILLLPLPMYQKEGKEAPPVIFDLTSLQVECNKKFAYSADETLKIIQSLYEKKVATYPRVDTTYLSDDIYPKCPGILKGLRDYATFTTPLDGTTLLKSKKFLIIQR